MDHTPVLPQNRACQINDIARISRTGAQTFNHRCIIAVRHKADILTVGFVSHRQPVFCRQRTRIALAGQMAQRKAQIVQLVRRGGKQKIGLIAVGIHRHMQLRPRPDFALNIMPRRHAVCVEIAGGGQQILEFHPLIAADAGHRGGPRKIGIGEIFDHRLTEGVFVIQHIMRKSHGFGHPARIVNVAPRAARPFFSQRRPVIIKLQRHPHHIIARLRQNRRHHRRINAARHRHHHAGVGRRFRKPKRIQGVVTHFLVQCGGCKRSILAQYRKILPTLNPPLHR